MRTLSFIPCGVSEDEKTKVGKQFGYAVIETHKLIPFHHSHCLLLSPATIQLLPRVALVACPGNISLQYTSGLLLAYYFQFLPHNDLV